MPGSGMRLYSKPMKFIKVDVNPPKGEVGGGKNQRR